MIATTIEQSKRLMVAGVKQQTADMSHRALAFEKDEDGRWFPQKGTPVDLIASKPSCELDVPAWSLSALIKLCPEHVPYRFIRTRGKDINGIFEDLVNYLCYKK